MKNKTINYYYILKATLYYTCMYHIKLISSSGGRFVSLVSNIVPTTVVILKKKMKENEQIKTNWPLLNRQ